MWFIPRFAGRYPGRISVRRSSITLHEFLFEALNSLPCRTPAGRRLRGQEAGAWPRPGGMELGYLARAAVLSADRLITPFGDHHVTRVGGRGARLPASTRIRILTWCEMPGWVSPSSS